MARPKRIWDPSGCYHIIMRGNNRQNIFIDQKDINEYYRILHYVHALYPFEVYAYCIMTNHSHFLLRSPHVHLGTLMGRINKRYSDYYRKRHDYTGQIYENRYYSKEVVDPAGLLKVSAYIHRNPIETKAPMVRVMQDYPYSSFPYYFYNQKSPHPFVRLDFLPSLLPLGTDKAPKVYATYCERMQDKETSG